MRRFSVVPPEEDEEDAEHSVQPRVIPFPPADMALATGSTRVGGIVGIVRAGGRGLGR